MDNLNDILQELEYIYSSTDWNAVANDAVSTIESYLASLGSTGLSTTQIEEIAAFLFFGLMVVVFCISIIACVVMAVTVIVAVICLVHWFLREYLLPAIALYRMAKKAGYRYAFFAFIPFMQTYLEYVLPKKEFRLFFIRAPFEMRYIVAIVTIILSTAGVAVDGLFDFIPVVGGVIAALAGSFLAVCLVGSKWRKMYDLIRTYDTKKAALFISIFGSFVPLVYTIALLVYMNREPDFGAGNYYEPIKE